MTIRIVEYDDPWMPAIEAFNTRLEAAGSAIRFSPPGDPRLRTPTFHAGLLQKQFLVLDEGDNVRGGYILKFQDFWLAGKAATIADFRMPVSEAIVDRNYSHVAAAMLFNAQKRQPMLYGLGMGDSRSRLPAFSKRRAGKSSACRSTSRLFALFPFSATSST